MSNERERKGASFHANIDLRPNMGECPLIPTPFLPEAVHRRVRESRTFTQVGDCHNLFGRLNVENR